MPDESASPADLPTEAAPQAGTAQIPVHEPISTAVQIHLILT